MPIEKVLNQKENKAKPKVVTTFPNEKILWSDKKYAIVEADVNGKRTIVVSDYWRTDYVVEYGDGEWAMDSPEYFPRYVLNKVASIVKKR